MSKELSPTQILNNMRSVVARNAKELGAVSALSSDIDALPKESLEDINNNSELLDNFWSGYFQGEKIKSRREGEFKK